MFSRIISATATDVAAPTAPETRGSRPGLDADVRSGDKLFFNGIVRGRRGLFRFFRATSLKHVLAGQTDRSTLS